MRHWVGLGLAATVLMTSCKASVPLVTTRPPLAPAGRPAALTPAASGSTIPHPASPVAIQPAQVLVPAKGATSSLAGQVTLDAAYATSHGNNALVRVGNNQVVGVAGARVVSNDGATVVSSDGATVISNDASTLMDGAGHIVAQGGGNVIVPAALLGNDGSTLIGNDGSSLIGDEGYGLISRDGSGLVSQDGGSIVAQGGGNLGAQAGSATAFHLTAVAGATTGGEVGQLLPAAGMWVSVIDMHTGLAVPLGLDAAGKPVYTVYSDAQGKFSVQLPAGISANVRVVARAPGSSDHGLTLHVITGRLGKDAAGVNAQNAVATHFLRETIARQLLPLMRKTPDEFAKDVQANLGDVATGNAVGSAVGAGLIAELSAGFATIHQAFVDNHVTDLPPERQLDIALLAADVALADKDLNTYTANSVPFTPHDPDAAGQLSNPALGLIQKVFEDVRQGVQTAAGGDRPEAYFADKPYVRAAYGGRGQTIDQPADLEELITREYLSSEDHIHIDAVADIFDDLHMDKADRDLLLAAGQNLLFDLVLRVFAGASDDGQTPVAKQIADLISKVAPQLASAHAEASPSPLAAGATQSPEPAPAGPSLPPARVSTLAGPTTRESGYKDGDGTVARFHGPRMIAFNPKASPPEAYVNDDLNGLIRRVKLNPDGTTTVSTLKRVAPDGSPGALAKPWALAFGPDGTLYISAIITDNNFIMQQAYIERLQLDGSDTATETTIAGSTPGHQDGPGAQAHFTFPKFMTVSPDGQLYVSDADQPGAKTSTAAVRRIDLGAPDHPVTTIATIHPQGGLTAPPQGLAVGADGALYIGEEVDDIRVIRPPVAPNAACSLLAGRGDHTMSPMDGYYNNAWFSGVYGLADLGKGADGIDRLVVADGGANLVRGLTQDGVVYTLAGIFSPDEASPAPLLVDGRADQATFKTPLAVSAAPDGSIWVADYGNNCIRRIAPAR